MKVKKRKFRISEISKQLDIDTIEINNWEKEFKINPEKNFSGQRFYSSEDIIKFQTIKELIYDKKLSIEKAREKFKIINFKKSNNISVQAASSLSTKVKSHNNNNTLNEPEFSKKIFDLHKKLMRLRELP